EQVLARSRKYLHPTSRLLLTVVDAATGRPVAARVSVTGPDGRSFAPDDAWRHADDGVDHAERRFEYGYFHSAGISELTVPVGMLSVEVTRGPEYQVSRQSVDVAADSTRTIRVAVRRLTNLAAQGWWSADLHVHMNYGGHYRSDPRRLRAMAEAEDLHVIHNPIGDKERRIPYIASITAP